MSSPEADNVSVPQDKAASGQQAPPPAEDLQKPQAEAEEEVYLTDTAGAKKSDDQTSNGGESDAERGADKRKKKKAKKQTTSDTETNNDPPMSDQDRLAKTEALKAQRKARQPPPKASPYKNLSDACARLNQTTNALAAESLYSQHSGSKSRKSDWFTIPDARNIGRKHRFFFNITDPYFFETDFIWDIPDKSDDEFEELDEEPPKSFSDLDVKWYKRRNPPYTAPDLDTTVELTGRWRAVCAVVIIGSGLKSLVPFDADSVWWIYVSAVVHCAVDFGDVNLFTEREVLESDWVLAGSRQRLMREKRAFSQTIFWKKCSALLRKLRSVPWDPAKPDASISNFVDILYSSADDKIRVEVTDAVIKYFGAGHWQAATLFAAYTLRLHTKTSDSVSQHYNNNMTVLQSWLQLPEMPLLTSTGFATLAVGVRLCNYEMFWQVANSFFNDGAGWQAVKKWYASRLEFSGLALIAGLIVLNEQMPAPLYVKGIITSGTYATLICNLISFYLYAVVDIAEGTMERILSEAANFGFPYSSLPLRDRYYGRFCRMVSIHFLSWSAFFKQRRVGSIMIGSIQAALGQESNCPAVALVLYFWLGWFFMRKHMKTDTDADPLASPEFKRALKEAMERVEQGLGAAPDELPQVSAKSLGPADGLQDEPKISQDNLQPGEDDWFAMPQRDL